MSGSLRMILALGPLVAYFFTLAVWTSGKRPRVVTGTLDYALLSFGIGGLIAFGPIGEMLVRLAFRSTGLWGWLAMASLFALVAMMGARRNARRLVVYQVSREALENAVGDAMAELCESVARTVRGFEDRKIEAGVVIEPPSLFRAGVVEAYGGQAERLIAELRFALRHRLQDVSSPSTALGAFWFMISSATVLVGVFVSRWERYQEGFRALREIMKRMWGA